MQCEKINRCRMNFLSLAFLLVLLSNAYAQAAEPITANGKGPMPSEVDVKDGNGATHTTESLCPMIRSAAADNGLPVDFFARLIWQESRLNPNAVGPLTRSGGRAQGIAQFMPSTAQERLLHNPFDPELALPKSAEFLRELRAQFGNLGLAAAAYNAGPQRVQDWLVKRRPMPSETQAYVRIITGHPLEEWRSTQASLLSIAIHRDTPCVEEAERSAKSAVTPVVAPQKPIPTWAVQLVGDRSEMNAMASYNLLRKKHESILGSQKPVVVRTMLGKSLIPIWHRIRIEADSREAAEVLCSRLRAAGGSCLVERI
jgi:hypothetical protein